MAIHLINLDRGIGRLEEFRKRNCHLKKVVRFPGVDGKSLDRNNLIKDGIIASDLDYTAGSMGCALSHVSLWKKAVEERVPITVAEDDAIFSYHFEAQTRSLLANFRADWDYILRSAVTQCYTWLDVLPGGTGGRLQFFPGPLFKSLDQFQEVETEPSLLRARYLLGLVCYSVSPNGARALLQQCLPIRPMIVDFAGFGVRLKNVGIDCIMNSAFPTLKTYVCLPPLVIHDNTAKPSTSELDLKTGRKDD